MKIGIDSTENIIEGYRKMYKLVTPKVEGGNLVLPSINQAVGIVDFLNMKWVSLESLFNVISELKKDSDGGYNAALQDLERKLKRSLE